MPGMDDIKNGFATFIQSRLAKAIGTTFKDVGSLVSSLSDGATDQNTKDALKTVTTDANKLKLATEKWPDIASSALTNSTAIATAVGAGKYGSAAVAIAKLLDNLDAFIDAVAKSAVMGQTGQPAQTQIDAIKAIKNPIVQPVLGAVDGASDALRDAFDSFCSAAFGIDAASSALATNLTTKGNGAGEWTAALGKDAPDKNSAAAKAAKGQAMGLINLDSIGLTFFVSAMNNGNLGVRLSGNISAGLAGDPLMQHLIPKEGAKTDASAMELQFDVVSGLTLGSGKTKKIVLPARLDIGGVELREFALSEPAGNDKEIDITAVLALKVGPVLAMVAEGTGVKLTIAKDYSPTFKRPDGLGFRINAGPVTGGGYLAYRTPTDDYGGVLDLKLGSVGLYAIGLLKSSPFSMVAVMGVHFMPKIELGLGFTLNGVGGLLAVDRTVSIDVLSKKLNDGVVSHLLFPDDPISAAPTILDQLEEVFPAQAGAFVVGPIVELGWGSDSGLVVAKLGIVIALPKPEIIVLGTGQVQVPPPEVKSPRIVDLNIDIMAVLSSTAFFLRAALTKSKIGGASVSGEMALLIQWGGDEQFALSAGGFFPNFPAPPRMGDLARITIPLNPGVPLVSITATGYFALTSNSLQLGAAIDVSAKLGPLKGKGHLELDALFEWSPKIYFRVEVHASFEISFSGHTVAGAGFDGFIEGPSPWTLQGNASIKILFWTKHFNLGPYTWGDSTTALPTADAMKVVGDALSAPTAWTALSPKSRLTVLRDLTNDTPSALLIDPASTLGASQDRLPFKTPLQRIGASISNMQQLDFASSATIGNTTVALTKLLNDEFAPGQFQNLPADQQMSRPAFETLPSGFQLSPANAIAIGPATDASLTWETFYPQLPPTSGGGGKSGAAAWQIPKFNLGGLIVEAMPVVQNRGTGGGNPYEKIATGGAGSVVLQNAGMKQLASVATLATSGGAMATVQAAGMLAGHVDQQMVTAGMSGV